MPAPRMPDSWSLVVVAGVLVGFGTGLGGGCTRRVRDGAVVNTVDRCHRCFHGDRDRRGCSLASCDRGLADANGGRHDVWFDLRLGIADFNGGGTRGIEYRIQVCRVASVSVLALKNLWPSRTEIDPPLVIGAMLFGIGWGLVGLCPGQPWKILRRSPLALSLLSWPWRSAWFCSHMAEAKRRAGAASRDDGSYD